MSNGDQVRVPDTAIVRWTLRLLAKGRSEPRLELAGSRAESLCSMRHLAYPALLGGLQDLFHDEVGYLLVGEAYEVLQDQVVVFPDHCMGHT